MVRFERSTHRTPGGYVTYPGGRKGGHPGLSQSVVIGGPIGGKDLPRGRQVCRVHLMRHWIHSTQRWSYTTILHLTRFLAVEVRHARHY